MSVWYLDLDDEITDAVARLRAAKDDKVVLVLPPGSRIGTGRINFRLLAREAETRGLTVALVSSDAQVRALAAAAGLTSHGSVGDAERSLGLEVEATAPAGARSTTAMTSMPPAARVSTAVSATAAAEATAAADPGGSRFGSLLHRRREGYAVTPRTATSGTADGAITVIPHNPADNARIVRRGPSTRRRAATWGMRGAMVGALGAAALYVAYLTLPTATIMLTPGTTRLAPVAVPIVASPNTAVADPATGTIPAAWHQIPLVKSGTFPASGKDEELNYARGTVLFTSNNTFGETVIPEGTVVSTNDGRQYRTTSQVVLPKYSGDPPRPNVEVEVRAARRGPDGNTAHDTITVVPKGLDRLQIRVTNPDKVEGGSKQLRNKVTQKDCNTARDALLADLDTQLAGQAGGPATPGLTRYPTSASIGQPVLTPSCDQVVDTIADSFDMTASSTGTVLEVDESVLGATAQAHFQQSQDPTVQIAPGSVDAQQVGEPEVTTDSVTYPMEVTALVTRQYDPARIREKIAGRPVAEAQVILNQYGVASLVMWPDFVPTVPTDVNRITITDTPPAVSLPSTVPNASQTALPPASS